jgi:hypothetical protein
VPPLSQKFDLYLDLEVHPEASYVVFEMHVA